MNKLNVYLLLFSTLIISSMSASAAVEYDQNVTPDVIFGSGNTNGFFTTNRGDGIEIGLRAKIPFSGLIKSSGDGRYHYTLSDTDHDNNPATDNRWNFDWAINTDFDGSNGSELNEYTYELGLDADPSLNTNYLIFDPVTATPQTPFFDHSIGNNGTPNGGGVEATDEATYLSLLDTENVLQQSWRYSFFPLAPLDGYNPNVPGTYHVYLAVKDIQGNELLRSEIVVVIGGATFDDDITPDTIFGSGNSNGSFTTLRAAGIELGLRAKIPFSGLVKSSGDGKYQYTLSETDHDSNPSSDNRWNFDWSINTDFDDTNGTKLDQYTYEIGMDADPGAGTDFLIFDPVTPSMEAPFFDHSIGDNNTANGAGEEASDSASYLALLSAGNVLQQSWRYAFFPASPLDKYNPDVAGTYNVYIAIKDMNGTVIMRNEIVVNIVLDPDDENVTPDVVFGSGNSNGSFTLNRSDGVEVGLRAKIPFSGLTNKLGSNIYHYSLEETDHDNNPSTDNRWNFDWTINTDYDASNGTELNQYTYELGLDADPSENTDFLTFDPVTPSTEVPFFDHSIGDNSTGNGAGVEANDATSYENLLATKNVLQNSWRYSFFPLSPLDQYNPDVPGTYHIYLSVLDLSGVEVSRTEIVVVIGGIDYDEDVTNEVIFGSGNVNGQFTVDRQSSVEVGLRAKIPFNGLTVSNGDGSYSYTLLQTDHDNNPGTDNRWNFDWSINTDYDGNTGNKISQYTYELGLDSDPGLGTDFLKFDPITPSMQAPFFDHAIGDNNTANGAGTNGDSGNYQMLIDNNNLVQNSWRYSFFPLSPLDTYNPNLPGNYVVYLLVKDGENIIAKSEIQVLIEDAPLNSIPTTSPDSYAALEDMMLSVDAFSGLLINDTDADLNPLQVIETGTYQAGGIGGEFNIAPDGSFLYTPPADTNGVATLNYSVTDGLHQVSSSVTIEVVAVNDAPDFLTLGDVAYFNLTGTGNLLQVIEGYTFGINFGPSDENGQNLLGYTTTIISDSNNVLNDIVVTDEGFLIMDFTYNFGTALIELSLQDDGGTEFGGDDTSETKTFSVSNFDLIFANDFEPMSGLKVMSFLEQVEFYSADETSRAVSIQRPYYNFVSNKVHFMGFALQLDNDYQSRKVMMQLKSWMNEVLSSQNSPYSFR